MARTTRTGSIYKADLLFARWSPKSIWRTSSPSSCPTSPAWQMRPRNACGPGCLGPSRWCTTTTTPSSSASRPRSDPPTPSFRSWLYPRYVSLCFLTGASLDDPANVLLGNGKAARHVRLPTADVIDTPAGLGHVVGRNCGSSAPRSRCEGGFRWAAAPGLGRLEDRQVLGDRLAGHVEGGAQLPQALVIAFVQPVEQLPADGIGIRMAACQAPGTN
jgi:hypothetical protein